ncbi:glucosaminidase domain-containing protein [Hydrogenimonas sp.]
MVQIAGIFALLVFLTGCDMEKSTHETASRHKASIQGHHTVQSYRQTIQILDDIGYSEKAFKKGMKKIPRVVITRISKRWGEEAENLPVTLKKSIFLRLMVSGALIANEEVAQERQKMLKILKRVTKEPISRQDAKWLRQLAMKYKVIKGPHDLLMPQMLKIIKRRVDIVPPSLIVAQAAIESGWGTSRFALEGNALFGQWSFSDTSLKPKEQRKKLGNYGLATFETPLDSIRSYILNIDTHPAYHLFRAMREELRNADIPLAGIMLAPALEHYSERKGAYVEDLISLIRANHLEWIDRAELSDNDTIVINPDK